MDTTKSLIDAVKHRYALRSDYALAKFINVTTVTVGRWRKGATMSDENAIRFAGLLDLPAAYVVACIHAELASAVDPDDASTSGVWRQIADAFRETVALWLVLSLISFQCLAPSPAQAYSTIDVRNNVYYVTLLLFFLRLARSWRLLFRGAEYRLCSAILP